MNQLAYETLCADLRNRATDRFDRGDVIRWIDDGRYNYAVIKDSRGMWVITGTAAYYGRSVFTYDQLLDVLSKPSVSDIYVATEWKAINDPKTLPF